jgi:hypothetical protein
LDFAISNAPVLALLYYLRRELVKSTDRWRLRSNRCQRL